MNTPTLQNLARSEVRGLASYNAGLSSEAVRQRYGLSRIAKLGSNENPLGGAPGVAASIAEAAQTVALYPDAQCSAVRQALATRLALEPTRLIFGNGSEDLLSIISRVFLDHGDEVVTVIPSFGLHIIYPQACGAKVRTVSMKRDGSFDVEGMIAAIGPRTRLLMFSCPSNPVGTTLTADELQHLLDALPAHTLLIFDEAYYEYAQAQADYPDCLAMLEASGKPFILLRTFSKAYALAGLRIGYGITSDAMLANLVDRLRTPFNINRIAQAAAVAALADDEHLKAVQELASLERARMTTAMQALGLTPLPSGGNFLFFETPHEAETVNTALLQQGVIVKPWRESGYTRFLRVSVGCREDNDVFLAALAKVLTTL